MGQRSANARHMSWTSPAWSTPRTSETARRPRARVPVFAERLIEAHSALITLITHPRFASIVAHRVYSRVTSACAVASTSHAFAYAA